MAIPDSETISAYQRLFNSEDGHRVLQDMLRRFAYTQRSTFSENATVMAFNEGQRSVMVQLGHILELDPKQVDEEQDDAE